MQQGNNYNPRNVRGGGRGAGNNRYHGYPRGRGGKMRGGHMPYYKPKGAPPQMPGSRS